MAFGIIVGHQDGNPGLGFQRGHGVQQALAASWGA